MSGFQSKKMSAISKLAEPDVEIDMRHGGPYDRGGADAYYRRDFNPHYFAGDSYSSDYIGQDRMSAEQLIAYAKGYHDTVEAGDFKDWG